ncbi:hypothetical protein FGIG_06459 [Fasciola gigantica]|uniref:Uncharacterized protein n=1 Tax=Fasciola gigantica TaxID=46835 RepID=A0A504Y9R6_FASGI|nr:hypothetical protein FGIG_06459 [Fasciola gigantica]
MDETIKQSLLAWLSGILQRSISVLEIQNGSALIQLANLTEDVHLVSPDLTSPASLEAFLNYLDTMFQFRASCLFDIPAVICDSASEEEIFGVCMLVLLCCLQSRSRQRFMDAALNLDVDVQSVIFHLVHEPMTQLSADQNLTRECVLAGFRDTAIKEETMTTMHPSTLTVLDAFNGEDILSSSPIFRAPEPVRPKKKTSETITKREQVDRSDPEHLYSEDPSDDDLIADYRQPQSSSMSYPLSSSSLPHPPPPIASGDGMPAAAGIRHQRPTDLRLMLTSQSSNCRYSRHTSQSNSLVDLNDMSSGQKSLLHPPASPLATLKNLLDSPLWAQKASFSPCS